MNNTTKRNVTNWVENNLSFFPIGFTMDHYYTLSDGPQEDILSRLLKAYNATHKGRLRPYDTLSVTHIKNINPTEIEFNITLTKKLDKHLLRMSAVATRETLPQWNEISTALRSNFKNWVTKNARTFDPNFRGTMFPELSDDIKVQWLQIMAKKFGHKYPADLLDAKISLVDMVQGVKGMKLPINIMDAIDEILPVESLLQTVKRSDMDGWDAQTATEFAKGMKQEEIQALRDGRKVDKKRARLIGRARAAKSLEGYQTILSDELFDRDMFNIILNRMENKTAFESSWKSPSSKEIVKLLAEHPLMTTADLQRIMGIKSSATWGSGTQPEYNSNHLNTALAARPDFDEAELMKLVKKSQFDVKLSASKRDLSEANETILIEYTIKHHSHMPTQLKEIFSNLGVDFEDYKDEIIAGLYKKYNGDKWKSNGLKTLEVINGYNWLDEMPEHYKENIAKTIVKAYNEGTVTKDKLIKVIKKLSAGGIKYLLDLYDETGDDEFLPADAQEMFLF